MRYKARTLWEDGTESNNGRKDIDSAVEVRGISWSETI